MKCNRLIIHKFWKLTSQVLQTQQLSTINIIAPCPCINTEPCIPDECDVGTLCDQPKVIIIGAGMAGLSAAQKLINCGVHDVLVLEGAARPGGRIHSCECEQSPVDLGAQWIYGSSPTNMIYNLACQEGLISNPIQIYKPYSGIYMRNNGEAVQGFIKDKAIREFDQINAHARTLYVQRRPDRIKMNESLWDYFNVNIQRSINKNFKKFEQLDGSKVMYGLINDIKARIGVNLKNILANNYGTYVEVPGGHTGIIKGFKSILDPLLNSIPKENIMYKKKVRKILWKQPLFESKPVQICCSDNSVYKADFVLCTVSLGVLKHGAHDLFNPGLPPQKMEAINKLGFGNVTKIFFEYKKPFWIRDEGKLHLTWTKDEIMQRNWINSIGLIEDVPSNDKVLLTTVGGDEAKCLETLPLSKVVIAFTELLQKFLNNKTIPYPKNVLRSNWAYNELTKGSITYFDKETAVKHVYDLAEPLPSFNETVAPVLLFAGEATVAGQFGTVQAARLSGIREAERLLKIIKRFRGAPKMEAVLSCVQQ